MQDFPQKFSQKKKQISSLKHSSKLPRKNTSQLKILQRYYKKYRQPWKKEIMEMIMEETDLSYNQIYKWAWDQRCRYSHKQSKHQQKQDILFNSNLTDEFGGYSKPSYLQRINSNEDKQNLLDRQEDESLCEMVGIDLDQLVKDFMKKEHQKNREELLNQQKFQKQTHIPNQSELINPPYLANNFQYLDCNEGVNSQDMDIDNISEQFYGQIQDFYQKQRSDNENIQKIIDNSYSFIEN